MTIAAYLAADHARLGELLARATAHGVDPEAFRAFRGGLLRHIGIEEKLLFRALERQRGAPHPQAARLHRDHSAIASLLVPTPTPAIVAALGAVLGPHDEAEEAPDGVYAAADALPAAAAAELLARMQAARDPPQSAYNDGPAAFRQIAHTMAAAGIDHPPPTAQ